VILDSVSILILMFIWGASLVGKGRSFLAKHHWRIFFASLFTLFSYAAYEGYLLYKATLSHPIGQFFDIEYIFLTRIGGRIFAPYLVSLVFALVFMWAAAFYNKKYDERFFEKEEIKLGALSILLVGHPGWIFYFPSVIFVYLLVHIYYQLRGMKNERIPAYHLWVPVAIFVILIIRYWISYSAIWPLLVI